MASCMTYLLSVLVCCLLVAVTIQANDGLQDATDLKWQRSAFHFQPPKNFIGDPNGPLYYNGWYHLFYQYNPFSPLWGNMTWGHSVSWNLIDWYHLPFAMVPDHWYDIQGVFTGSATILPSGQIAMLYTGSAYDLSQLQCMAYPSNLSDPLLIEWVKDEGNPVLFPPPGVGQRDFRDPSTLWMGPDGSWRLLIGSKKNKTVGCALVYHTTDFKYFKLKQEVFHAVPDTGMWECVDLYPVSTTKTNGLDMSVDNGPNVKYILKESGDDNKRDWYSIGTLNQFEDKWYPDNPEKDLGIGLMYDYGKLYASKTFFDPSKNRRVLWGFVGETDPPKHDIAKGWANIMNIPRTVFLDLKTKTNLIQWPVEETKKLRSKRCYEFKSVELRPGSIIPLQIGTATQLDIVAVFEVDQEATKSKSGIDDHKYNCMESSGASERGRLGPFGVLVLADEILLELTPIYFYIAKDARGGRATHFCTDKLRSTLDGDSEKVVYGSSVPVVGNEDLTMRLLVDHSIVEGFAQNGRTVVTSRVYPTKAIYGAAKIFLFNNATGMSVKASIKIWKMKGAQLKDFPHPPGI